MLSLLPLLFGVGGVRVVVVGGGGGGGGGGGVGIVVVSALMVFVCLRCVANAFCSGCYWCDERTSTKTCTLN